jgi:Zn-dependent peptidase ImmA (M78 family)
MISEAQARSFAESTFPEAPEKLAECLRIDVRYSPLSGCDGWCLVRGEKAIVHLNNKLSTVRQRFTLAHELGHLILGIPTVVGETYEDMLRSDSDDERRVNDLASALLIPAKVAKKSLSELPVVTAALQKLAKKAKVSELAAAIRVCNLAREIGLVNASVVQFNNDQIRWQWSKTISMTSETAVDLLSKTRKTVPQAFRHVQADGKVIVASTIENPTFGTATLFVQLLTSEDGLKLSTHEKRLQLESQLFEKSPKLRPQVNGSLGYFKNIRTATSVRKTVAEFWQRYGEMFKNTALSSKAGRAYVELRIGEWF